MKCIHNPVNGCCLKVITPDKLELPICTVNIICDLSHAEKGEHGIEEEKGKWRQCLDPGKVKCQCVK
jgi:hypothetical protein